MPMNPEIKAHWLEALRSGKYKQAYGQLRDGATRMCCLGVLCDIVDPSKWAINADGFYYHTNSRYDMYPPPEVCEKAGISEPVPVLSKHKQTITNRLASLNDYGNKSFAEIADFIEENL